MIDRDTPARTLSTVSTQARDVRGHRSLARNLSIITAKIALQLKFVRDGRVVEQVERLGFSNHRLTSASPATFHSLDNLSSKLLE
jgi:hypothetical protein